MEQDKINYSRRKRKRGIKRDVRLVEREDFKEK